MGAGLRDVLLAVAAVGVRVLVGTGLQREADRVFAGVASAELGRRADRVRALACSSDAAGDAVPASPAARLERIVRAAEGSEPAPLGADLVPPIARPGDEARLRWRLLVAAHAAMLGLRAAALSAAPDDRPDVGRRALADVLVAIEGRHPLDPVGSLSALPGG